MDRSMRNIDLAWKRRVDYALFDRVHQKYDLFDISSQHFRL